MTSEKVPAAMRDVVMGVLVVVVGAAALAFANLPARVAVVESSQTDIKRTVERMDGKMDILLQRSGRR